MLATEILTQEHREALDLISRLEGAGAGATGSYDGILKKLEAALLLHMREEEEIYYPAVAKNEEFSDLLSYSIPEHETVREYLTQLDGLAPSDETFQDVLGDLRSAIEDHAENEEDEVFPKSIEVLGEDRIEELGDEIQQLKDTAGKRKTATP
jgi:iron-sulfur cluster repair protein YtfE (RIC family)